MTESKPLVSIIVPTKNSAKTINACLQSTKAQTYPYLEVILVDDFSKDKTREVAGKFGAFFVQRKSGMSQARNIGVAEAKGSLFLSMDSDMRLTSKVIEECVGKIRAGYDAVIIPEVSIGVGFWAECVALEKRCYLGDELIEASRFFKKEVIEDVGCYDSSLETGEDWDMHLRVKKAGYRIGRVNAAILHNEGRLMFWSMVKKKYRYGKTLNRYERKHPAEAKQQFNVARPALVRNWRKLTRYPKHFFGLFFLKGCEFAAIKLGSISAERAESLAINTETVQHGRLSARSLTKSLNMESAPQFPIIDHQNLGTPQRQSEEKPLVSIVIPTKNSAETIEKCMKSIRAQSYRTLEVIVVDNYSTDQTREIAAKFGAEVYVHGPERSSQVNFGVSQARGKYVYRIDSDFVLDADVVSEAVERSEKEGYDAIAVHNTSDSTVSFWAKVRKMERDSYINDDLNVGARFWKKSVFESIGGFDVSMIAGDDYDLQNRLIQRGFRVGRIKAQETHLGEPRNLAEVLLKHYYYGQNIEHFIKKNRQRGLQQLNPFRSSLTKGLSKATGEPALIFGFIIYQFIRYVGASLGMLSAAIRHSS